MMKGTGGSRDKDKTGGVGRRVVLLTDALSHRSNHQDATRLKPRLKPPLLLPLSDH